jgi:hypothetical protein
MEHFNVWVVAMGAVGVLAFFAAVVVGDAVAYTGGDHTRTVTWVVREFAVRYPLLMWLSGLVTGLLLGHLFWE